MTQEDKELLLKDLCARLPYDIKCRAFDFEPGTLLGIDGNKIYLDYPIYDEGDGYFDIEFCKPYLRPMFSMTEEERFVFNGLCNEVADFNWEIISYKIYDWLNAHHFDYRGLIPMGLALEATEGMY